MMDKVYGSSPVEHPADQIRKDLRRALRKASSVSQDHILERCHPGRKDLHKTRFHWW